jgi:hypothetical protein
MSIREHKEALERLAAMHLEAATNGGINQDALERYCDLLRTIVILRQQLGE